MYPWTANKLLDEDRGKHGVELKKISSIPRYIRVKCSLGSFLASVEE